METNRARIAGLETSWVSAGPEEGPPVLLLHGGGIDRASRSWKETLPALAGAGYRVLAPDMPGYGQTEGFSGLYGVAHLRDWCLDLMHEVFPGPLVIIGNSMGGATALALALRRPDALRGVIPVGSFGLAAAPPLAPLFWLYTRSGLGRAIPWLGAKSRAAAWAGLAVLFARPSRITRDLVEDLHQEAARQVKLQSFRAFLRYETRPLGFRTCHMSQLAECSVPALYIHGRSDRLIPIRHARAAAARHPGAAFTELDAGHWPMREQPAAFRAAVLPWLHALHAEDLRRPAPLARGTLQLRAPGPGDLEALEALQANPEVRRFLGGPLRGDQGRLAAEQLLWSVGPELHWVVEAQGTFAGLVSLGPHKDGLGWELSYQFRPEVWGKGWAQAACAAVLDYAFRDLDCPQVFAETQVANTRSRALLTRLGFGKVREVKRYGALQGIYAVKAPGPCAPTEAR